VRFPLKLRVPVWADKANIQVNGKPVESVRAGTFALIDREWKSSDRVELQFPMRPTVSRSYHNAVVIERGPVVYSLDISTEWRKLKSRGMTADWEAYPQSAWNYALAINEHSAGAVPEIKGFASDQGVFTAEGAPIKIEVQARKLPSWKAEDGCAGELPHSPVASDQPQETLRLVPYGAAKLRITAFPELTG